MNGHTGNVIELASEGGYPMDSDAIKFFKMLMPNFCIQRLFQIMIFQVVLFNIDKTIIFHIVTD